MNILEQLQSAFKKHLADNYNIPTTTPGIGELTLNVDENKQDFGDLSSNTAMILAKQLGKAPRILAQEIIETFRHPLVEKVEIAGPGFINIFLTQPAFTQLANQLHKEPTSFFMPTPEQKKESFCIEFVSANPTGPLHFGHGRGGIIGDVLGNILKFLGHKVDKEFYINDAGAQIEKLGRSFKARCQEAAGLAFAIPEDGYHGEYLLDLAKECIKENGTEILDKPDSFFAEYAKTELLERIKHTLDTYGINFDVWFSEKSLHDSGAIESAIKGLEQSGYLFENEGATWFKSTAFGDDKDRVVCRANGEYTYVAADIAYMKNKIDRGYNALVYVLGHDHHSYATRLQGLFQAQGLEKDNTLAPILYQLVKIKQSGQQVRMSKRAGNIITLDDVIEATGRDVARFFYLNRKADAQLEFDLDIATKKSDENPAYYIQYAYVRTGSILNKASEIPELRDISGNDAAQLDQEERFLLKKIASLKELLLAIGSNHQTHLLAHYTLELAQMFSRYYAKHRVIDTENPQLSRGRLLLVKTMRDTLALCLELLGLSKPERM
jgi:arginyl-tRNA synthetase